MNRWISKIHSHVGYFHLKSIVEFKRFILPVHVEIFPFKMYYWNSYEVKKMPQLWLEKGRKQFLCCLLFIAFFTMGYWLIYRCFVLVCFFVKEYYIVLFNSWNFRVCRGISVYPWKHAISSEKVFLLFFSMTLGFHDSPLSWLLLALQYIATLCATKLWPVSQV